MPKSKLDAAFRGLRSLDKVSTQKEFGDTLGYNKSYFSQLMNDAEPITDALKDKCFDKFGIPKQWWDTSLDTPLTLTSKPQAPNYTKPTTTKGKVGNWILEMRNELYSKINSKLPPSEIDKEI